MNKTTLLLRLYPRMWRERYEEEFLAMLEERAPSFADQIDIVLGAIDAHLHPQFGTRYLPLQERLAALFRTLRGSLITLFAAYIGFVVAGIVFEKMTEDGVARVAHASALAGAAYTTIFLSSIVALLAILIGGLPMVLAIGKQAVTTRRIGPVLLLAVPPLAFGALLLYIRITPPGHGILSRLGFVAFFFVEAIISTAAVCLAIARSKIDARLFRFAALPAMVAAAMMLVMFVAELVWGLGLYVNAPSLFIDHAGFMQADTATTWLWIAVTMALATGVAFIALARGLAARSVLRNIS